MPFPVQRREGDDGVLGSVKREPLPDRLMTAGAAILVGALLLALVGRPAPIVIWDEARIVINAMEMRWSGFASVATYRFHPDLWNTKPPLLVWLMTASTALFGPSEWSLRLPSTIASLATLLLVMAFLRRLTGSLPIALLGAVILAASVGFFGEHGARTGDYDALLCFLTTAYLQILFFAVHRRRPTTRWLLLAATLGAAALLTKGIAGAVPAAGLALYLIVTGRWRRMLRVPAYLLAAVVAVVPVLLFLLIREAAAPGYLAAMIYNDVSGRFGEALDAHGGPPWYYLDATFFAGLFSFGPATLLAPAAILLARGKARQGLIFAACIALGQLIVVTATATKLSHYYLPAYPFLAIMVALAVHATLRALGNAHGGGSRAAGIAVKLAVTLLLARGLGEAVDARRSVLVEREYYPRARYGEVLAQLSRQPGQILVFERGFPIPDDRFYAPQLMFYAMVAREHGRQVEQVTDAARIAAAPRGAILVSCDNRFRAALRRRGPDLVTVPGCLAVR